MMLRVLPARRVNFDELRSCIHEGDALGVPEPLSGAENFACGDGVSTRHDLPFGLTGRVARFRERYEPERAEPHIAPPTPELIAEHPASSALTDLQIETASDAVIARFLQRRDRLHV